tara:strand:+ start:4343 stop:4732 length:390 start_codon:yes stop_codon:yes gene_type:complete
MMSPDGQQMGLIVFAHGSTVPEANEAVRKVAEKTAQRCGLKFWSQAFLEPIQPDLATAVQRLSQEGVQKIVVTPYFLTMGVHLQKDLPRILERVSSDYPSIEIVCSPSLDGNPALVDILVRYVEQALGS